MRCPQRFRTRRLLLRKPQMSDASAIFSEYAGDVSVGKYLAWPIHRTLDDTEEFLRFSENEWSRWPAGPYLILDADESTLLGSTGLAFESEDCASTGYVIGSRHWGNGYATEALEGVTRLSQAAGVTRLYALCHPDHPDSQKVLRKCGFHLEKTLANHCVFPNQPTMEKQDVCCFVWAGIQ